MNTFEEFLKTHNVNNPPSDALLKLLKTGNSDIPDNDIQDALSILLGRQHATDSMYTRD